MASEIAWAVAAAAEAADAECRSCRAPADLDGSR